MGRRWSTSSAGSARSWRWPCCLRFWQPKQVWRFPDEPAARRHAHAAPPLRAATSSRTPGCPGSCCRCWCSSGACRAFKAQLNGGDAKNPNALAGISKLAFEVPYLHGKVYRTAPVAAGRKRLGPRPRSRDGHLRIQLAVGHRHRHFSGRRADRLLAADFARGLRWRSLSTPWSRCAGPC